MDAQERLRQLIREQEDRLRTNVPPDRQAALPALLGVWSRSQLPGAEDVVLGVVAGHTGLQFGGNKALQLCLESAPPGADQDVGAADSLDRWAERLLSDCRSLAIAERVLMHSETGFMRLASDDDSIDAWIASSRAPASWRERVDFDWWTTWLADRHHDELAHLRSHLSGGRDGVARAAQYPSIAAACLSMMEHQAGYPDDAVIGGVSISTYQQILKSLISMALSARGDDAGPLVMCEATLVTSIAAQLSLPVEQAAQAVAAFTLDQHNAAYHAAVPGIAPAPLVRLGPDRIALSLGGLIAEPMLFLMRELRRRDAQAYHNAAWQRESAFRTDLYGLFHDKRFVTSNTRIQLRREKGGLRTDVDAAVFDRKTGVLGLFELKSQDPFARSTAELIRQRDNVLQANHQVSGILDWLNRNGADELLNRIDHATAKRFRVRKVLPFVLGRSLVHFPDGPAPDSRAAWATWPQVLRLTGGLPFSSKDANPLVTLFTRLQRDMPLALPPLGGAVHELEIGRGRLTIFPSYRAYKEARST